VGLGDYCEWINVQDKRFDVATLAPWIEIGDLIDLAQVQRDRFLSIIKPIAGKCLAMCSGNHEGTIHRKTERDIYSEIVTTVKAWGKLDGRLGIGRYSMDGWGLVGTGGYASCTIGQRIARGVAIRSRSTFITVSRVAGWAARKPSIWSGGYGRTMPTL
jgi:hypothetical protein